MNSALWALIGVGVGACATGLFNLLLQSRQFRQAKEMYKLEHKSSEVVKELLLEMLNHRSHIDRSLTALKRPVGGYSDDEIRHLLHEVGARRATRDDGSEWWYLTAREPERMARRQEQSKGLSERDRLRGD